MNEIKMIPVGQLYHHPENPRRDLGDLTELADSIRQNGIMQNLTVIPGHMMSIDEYVAMARAEGVDKLSAIGTYTPENAWTAEGYTVVIGNRRMEAAKAAGIAEAPCVISDMDHKTQISTMLMENMQRNDLTAYEQAQGFQMMMDLGFTEEEISEKTGFSRTTVARRLKMAELDGDTFMKAVGKQISMDELDRLGQIKSVKQRNALLKEFGEDNYNWKVTQALRVQKAAEMKPKALKMIREAGIQKLPDQSDRYNGKYTHYWKDKLELNKWNGKDDFIPKHHKMFYWDDDCDIDFYFKEEKKKAEPVKKTETEKEEDKRRELAWKTIDRSAETAAELRAEYVKKISVNPKNAMRMMQWTLAAAIASMLNYQTPTLTIKHQLKPEGVYTPEVIASVHKKIMDMPQKQWPELILMMFEGDWRGQNNRPPRFADGSRKYQFPIYKRNVPMELCYEWLTEFGYQMSTEEVNMMAGTDPAYRK